MDPENGISISDLMFQKPEKLTFEVFELLVSSLLKYFEKNNLPPQFFKRLYGHVYILDTCRVLAQIYEKHQNGEIHETPDESDSSNSDKTTVDLDKSHLSTRTRFSEFNTNSDLSSDNDDIGELSTQISKFDMSRADSTFGVEKWRDEKIEYVYNHFVDLSLNMEKFKFEHLNHFYFSLVVSSDLTQESLMVIEVYSTYQKPTFKLNSKSTQTIFKNLNKIVEYLLEPAIITSLIQPDLRKDTLFTKLLTNPQKTAEAISQLKLFNKLTSKRKLRNPKFKQEKFTIYKHLDCTCYL